MRGAVSKKLKSSGYEGSELPTFLSDQTLEDMVDNASVTCMELLRLVEATKSRSTQFFPQPPPPLLQIKPYFGTHTNNGPDSASKTLPLSLKNHPPEVKKEYDESAAIVNPKAEDACLARVNDMRRQTLQNALLAFEQIRMDCVRQEGLLENEPYKRADLKAGSIMKERGLWLDEQKVIGEIPGVLVGDIFNYRMQMCLVGLHRQLRAGIDYIPAKDSAFNVSIATSVVICTDENYGDDTDMGDTVVYTGQGGLARGGKKLPDGTSEDQKLVRGNIALKNSFDLHVPIRLIRGHRIKNQHSGIVYRYDGLYVIYDMKYEACAAGNNVFKFLLQRMKGQPPLRLAAPSQPQQNLLTYSGSLPKENGLPQNEGPLILLEATPNASSLATQSYH